MKELLKLKEPLLMDEVDIRIQSINNGKYATILAYKDARVDMNRLDDVVGAGFWKREHFDNNTRCKVSIYNKEIKEWVSKEDVGTQSQTEKEKGLASDSFKRACFNWGIGRELYDYPVISIKLTDKEVQLTGRDKPKYKASFDLKLKEWKWITEFKEGKLVALACKDNHGKLRFNHGKFTSAIEKEVPPANILPKKIDYTKQESQLKECKTLDELKEFYSKLNKQEQKALTTLKNEFKLKLK